MKKLPISVCMIAGPEAGRIGRALGSVAEWTSEIIVVVNADVADDTEKIALAHGSIVHREPWKGHIAQKNSAAQKAVQPWLLGLDADEVVPQELQAEIAQILDGPGPATRFAAFSFPRLTQFCGRWIRHGDWYPDRQTRLWQRSRAHWGGIDPHDRLMVDGPVGRLSHHIEHFTNETIDAQLAKIGRYSEDFLRDARARRRPATFFDLAVRPPWRFLRSYFLRAGFLDGWQGWYIAWMTAFYTATRYAKVREALSKKAGADRETLTGP